MCDSGKSIHPIPIGSRTACELAAAELTGPWRGLRVDVRPGRNCAKLAVHAPPVIKNWLFQIPAAPGLGLRIDPAYVREHTPKGDDWA